MMMRASGTGSRGWIRVGVGKYEKICLICTGIGFLSVNDEIATMTPDREQLRIFVETRSEEAFLAMVSAHLPMVYATARRMLGGDATLAEDVAQQVFADSFAEGLVVEARGGTQRLALSAYHLCSPQNDPLGIAAQGARATGRRSFGYGQESRLPGRVGGL